MAYTKEQRIINLVSGNTKQQRQAPKETNLTGSFNIPNKSGDHMRSYKRDAPINDYDLVNKEYCDGFLPLTSLPLSINNGGTNSDTDYITAANQIIYYDGTRFKGDSNLVWDGEEFAVKNGASTIFSVPVGGNILLNSAVSITGTTTLSSGLTGFLKASSGVVSTDKITLSADVDGILPIANGGTNNTSYTTGSVIFYDGSKLAQDNGGLFFNSTTDRLGVNTSSPSGTFHVKGDNGGDFWLEDAATAFRIHHDGNSWAVIYNYSTGDNVYWGEATDTGSYIFRGKDFQISTIATIGGQALTIDQNDADQSFIDFQGTESANLSNNISSYTTEGGTVKYIKCEINGTAYWFRACTAPTS